MSCQKNADAFTLQQNDTKSQPKAICLHGCSYTLINKLLAF